MPKNALYNVINKVTINEEKIPGVVDLSLRTYQEGKTYFFFELPLKDELIIGNYKLVNHHLSVSESPLGKIDIKSQYHYTAYFDDREGNRYRLHIYYDAQGNNVCEPLLSLVQEEDTFKSVNCEELHEVFKQLAEQFIGSVVAHLRANQRSVVAEYQAQYEQLEKKACSLSVDCVKNKEEYLATIQKQIAVLNELTHYSNDNRATNNLLSFHRRVIKTMELTAVVPVASEEAPTASASKRKTDSNKGKRSSFAQKHHVNSELQIKPKAVKSKPRLDEVIAQLEGQLEQLKKMKDEQQVSAIPAFFGSLIVEECALERGKYLTTAQDVCNLHLLRMRSEEQAKRVLLGLLVVGQYEQAAQLKAFHHTLPDTMMPFALTQNKPGLIDFLLKHKVVPFNYKNFVVKETQYSSLLDFYFKQKPTEQSSLIDGIDVLIKNAPSLLMDIDNKTRLPFAAVILLDPAHPLRPALERNADITINNPMFYKQLNQVLHALIVQSSYSQVEMEQIIHLINSNNEKMSSVVPHTPSVGSSFVQLKEELIVKLRATVGNDFVEQLLCDPVIASLRSLIDERRELLMSKLPRSVQTGIRHQAQENFDAIKKELDDVENIDLLPAIVDKIRSRTIEHQLDTLNAIALREELIDVQNSIHSTVVIPGKRNKSYHALLRRQDIILAELKAYGKRSTDTSLFSNAILDEFLSNKLKELSQAFDSLSKMLQECSSLLLASKDGGEVENEKTVESIGKEGEKENEGEKEKEETFSYSHQTAVKTLFSVTNTLKSINDGTPSAENECKVQ